MKAKQINKIIDYGIIAAGAYFIGSAILGAIKRKREGTSGIGAAKRRVFKELSLAQKAGVDFTKKYDELSPSEIKALQKVSNDTGYTETYYKSLKKAYDAISGIGASYDVVNADGDTVLTWIEDPENPQAETARKAIDDAERYLALREARQIEDDREWARQNGERNREEMEARLAEQRKRLKKSGRSSQMALFGMGGYPTYSRRQLDTYIGSYHITELVAEAETENKILCSIGDEKGGRGFYLGSNNFMYLFNYCLMNRIPIALWNGARWITRNGGEELLQDSGIETELFEIWREQLDNGETEYDYDKWRKVFGNEYAKDVLKYMR